MKWALMTGLIICMPSYPNQSGNQLHRIRHPVRIQMNVISNVDNICEENNRGIRNDRPSCRPIFQGVNSREIENVTLRFCPLIMVVKSYVPGPLHIVSSHS